MTDLETAGQLCITLHDSMEKRSSKKVNHPSLEGDGFPDGFG